jgi:dTDP-4-dehydrorhamnose reductase
VRVLLTGAEGQLGRVVRSGFGAHQVIAPPEADLDICGPGLVETALDEARPDLVFNAAAYTDVDGARTDQAAFAGNARGPAILAAATGRRGIPILQISTDYVFDGEAGRPYHERDETGPCSVYGLSKLEGEEAVRRANPRHFVVRTSWLYAAEGRNFPLTMLGLAGRPEVRVVNDQFGALTFAPHLSAGLLELLGRAPGAPTTWPAEGRELARARGALYRELGIRDSGGRSPPPVSMAAKAAAILGPHHRPGAADPAPALGGGPPGLCRCDLLSGSNRSRLELSPVPLSGEAGDPCAPLRWPSLLPSTEARAFSRLGACRLAGSRPGGETRALLRTRSADFCGFMTGQGEAGSEPTGAPRAGGLGAGREATYPGATSLGSRALRGSSGRWPATARRLAHPAGEQPVLTRLLFPRPSV